MSFFLLFISILQQNWRKHRIGSALKEGATGDRVGVGAGERNDPNVNK
jgi:hypothetical protein